jgi:dihydroorotate dehydrogenase electron transfer subunit
MEAPAKKGVFEASVLAHRQVGDCFHVMTVQFTGAGAAALAHFRAGQFVQIDLAKACVPPAEDQPPEVQDSMKRSVLLRRPFSFADVAVQGNIVKAELLYCALGAATLRMTTFRKGDSISVIGPLGNGFTVPEGKRTALLVVGGMGAPPIRCLAKSLTAEHPEIEAAAFVGARTAQSLPFEGRLDAISQQLGFSIPAFGQLGIPSVIVTDDGSIGRRGLVTDSLVDWLNENSGRPRNNLMIYACGPEQMLAAVAKIAAERNIDCQVSMERRMACGIGLCQSCAVECKVSGSSETIYKLCCQDGPVFNAREVIFASGAD